MVDRVTSQTALKAAAGRAAHLLVDQPPYLLDDPVAERMLGDRADELIDRHRLAGADPVVTAARAQVTARTRFTEDRLAAAGLDQYVLLGAGLDSFAHRSPLAGAVRVFEVDHPETQEYKRSVAPDGPVTYVPVDFATDGLLDRLTAAGFDPARPAFVSWLGVSVYLDLPDIERLLAVVGAFAPGSELVAEHMLPAGHRDAAGDAYIEAIEPMVVRVGEPWRSMLSAAAITDVLQRNGFGAVRSVRQRDWVDPVLWERSDGLAPIQVSALAHAVVG